MSEQADQIQAEVPAAPAPAPAVEDKQPAEPTAEDSQASDTGTEVSSPKVKLSDGRELTEEQIADIEKKAQSYEKLRPEFTKVTQERSKLEKALQALSGVETTGAPAPVIDPVTEIKTELEDVKGALAQERLEKAINPLKEKFSLANERDALEAFVEAAAQAEASGEPINEAALLEASFKASHEKIDSIRKQAYEEGRKAAQAEKQEEQKAQIETGGTAPSHVPTTEAPTDWAGARRNLSARLRASRE